MLSNTHLKRIENRVRDLILLATTQAQSGHPTSSLSAVDLMVILFFGGFFRADLSRPNNQNNDRLIFSKGHAAPLLYALYVVAGKISKKELGTLRKKGSRLEGHPTLRFPYTESPTGSLGQGLSVGLGIALDAKYLSKISTKTYVLLGDGEMAEGQIWEAVQLAAHYKLNNLIGIIDVNRLGQTGPTMYGHNVASYQKKLNAFGWKTIVIDGHNTQEIKKAYAQAQKATRPYMIIAKTIKGKGVSFLENKNGWHGKVLSREQLHTAREELGHIFEIPTRIKSPTNKKVKKIVRKPVQKTVYSQGELVAPRVAYGNALARLGAKYAELIVLDAEVSNSTKTDMFKKIWPKRFFEMYIAEQNMVSAGVGLATRGHIVSINSFAAFLGRAFDQIRMSQYTHAHLIYAGSHAGVSIGHDGASQMGLEDISMFRTLLKSVVLYPSDAVSTEECTHNALKKKGLYYIRNTRAKLPVLYKNSERFPLGGSKTLTSSAHDCVSVVAAGITVHEALHAYSELKKENKHIRVIDLYSIKPIDEKTLKKAARETNAIIVVEDHFAQGGIADAVRTALHKSQIPIFSLAVKKMPQSGTTSELLLYEEISSSAIIRTVRRIINKK